MSIVARLKSKGWEYELDHDFGRWVLIRSKGKEFEDFPLDYDRRHQRLFLSEKDQRHVGADGISVLEKLTRKVLDR